MMYESKKTPHGNVGVSFKSQEAANMQASQMDANNCRDCYGCSDCRDCRYCHGCSDCRDCLDCYDCRNCYDCYRCHNCSDCHNCSGCTGVLRWSGSKASSLLALNGLTWPVATDGKNIQIGCQYHSVEAWRGFSDAEISSMEEHALVFWREHKDQILLLAETRRSMKTNMY